MQKKEKKYSIIRYNTLMIILCVLLLLTASYLSYDKYFGPTYNWFKYQEKNVIKPNCDKDLKNYKNEELKKQEEAWKKVTATFNNAKELINSEKLLSPYVDVKIDNLKLSCQKIQKDLLTIYFSDTILNNILSNYTINNEFVNCLIKETGENYGPRNIFNDTIFNLDSEVNIIPLAYEENYYLTFINNNYIIFEKTNGIWKINHY